MTVNLYMKNPAYRNPKSADPTKKLRHNSVMFPYASYFTTRTVTMHDPFKEGDTTNNMADQHFEWFEPLVAVMSVSSK